MTEVYSDLKSRTGFPGSSGRKIGQENDKNDMGLQVLRTFSKEPKLVRQDRGFSRTRHERHTPVEDEWEALSRVSNGEGLSENTRRV